jgi:hypothetical protein
MAGFTINVWVENDKAENVILKAARGTGPEQVVCFKSPPSEKPLSVPKEFMIVKVYHRGRVMGYLYMDPEQVAQLYKPRGRSRGAGQAVKAC